MESAVWSHPHAAVVTLTGELDADTASRLRGLVAEHLLAGPGNLVLDLSGLSFIDSAGLAAMVAADKGVRRAGMRLILVAPRSAVSQVMHLTGIDTVMTTVDTVPEALAMLLPG